MDEATLRQLSSQYLPKVSSWFSKKVMYEGWGKANFRNPRGSLEGKAIITVSGEGELHTEMEMEKLTASARFDGTDHFRIRKFLHRNRRQGNMVTIGLGEGGHNQCSSFVLQTPNGVFRSSGRIGWDDRPFGKGNTLFIYLPGGKFTTKTRQRARYWAAPLTNFLAAMHDVNPRLNKHPLRIFPTPDIPELPPEEMKHALWLANSRNYLIVFSFAGQLGFIEGMPDYKEIEERLRSGESKQSITSVMVGDVTGHCADPWFPRDYSVLLTFLSGASVGVPWIEFRARDGALVSRRHLAAIDTGRSYSRGYAAIDESLNRGTGTILSLASSSPEFRESYYHALISQLTRLSPDGRHLEDGMALAVRALDALCEKHHLSVQVHTEDLSKESSKEVDVIIADAQKRLTKLDRRVRRKGEFREAAALQRIGSKIANAKNTDRNFGLAVADLLYLYGLVDFQLMEKYYAENPGLKYGTWANLLSHYRGTAIHSGYFKILNGADDFYLVVQTIDHLHDILVRLALKILGYQGTYQPRVAEFAVSDRSVEWVTPATPISSLGYR